MSGGDVAPLPRRIRLMVEVSLDPVPGWGDNPGDFRNGIQRLLDDSIGHYKPFVTIVIVEGDPS